MKFILVLLLFPSIVIAVPKDDLLLAIDEIKFEVKTRIEKTNFKNPLKLNIQFNSSTDAFENIAMLAINFSSIKRFIKDKKSPKIRNRNWYFYGTRNTKSIHLKLAFKF